MLQKPSNEVKSQFTQMAVNRYNYRHQLEEVEESLLTEIHKSLLEGQYILTEQLEKFELDFAEYVGSNYAIGVNSGTDALILALNALSIGPSDEVITVANTFHATVLAILRTGARPVLVDCNLNDYLIDVEQLKAAVTQHTRAIIVVHLFGKALNMTPILEIASQHGLYIIEDCCQAIGAKFNQQRIGSIGTIGCFSFHPSKNLAAAGDAGAITTNDPILNDRLRKLRHFGQETQNNHKVLGFNSKLDVLQALVLHHKLPFLDKWNSLRVEKAEKYKQKLSQLPLRFQLAGQLYQHVYHLFQVRTEFRCSLLSFLHSTGIDAVVRYPVPIHLQPALSILGYKLGDFPNSEILSNETLCLPIRPDLTEKEITYVCERISEFFDAQC